MLRSPWPKPNKRVPGLVLGPSSLAPGDVWRMDVWPRLTEAVWQHLLATPKLEVVVLANTPVSGDRGRLSGMLAEASLKPAAGSGHLQLCLVALRQVPIIATCKTLGDTTVLLDDRAGEPATCGRAQLAPGQPAPDKTVDPAYRGPCP